MCLCCFLILLVCAVPFVLYGLKELHSLKSLRVDDDEVALAFAGFVRDFDKSYASDKELQYRKAVFAANYARINAFNSEKHNFKLGVNQFADLTQDEFRAQYLSKSEPVDLSEIPSNPVGPIPSEDDEKDWVKEGKVSPVRDQGNCGSCWTFSAIAAVESLDAIKQNRTAPVAMSEQQLVDCCKTSLSNGCLGGERWEAFEYIARAGIASREDYPYLAYNSDCKESAYKKVVYLKKHLNITKGSSPELAAAVLKRPISVGVNASPFAFMFYRSGIVDEGCPADEINHGVVAVGVGKKDGVLYWKVRNSWSPKWGDGGYIYIKRETTVGPGLCAIAMKGCMPVYPDESE